MAANNISDYGQKLFRLVSGLHFLRFYTVMKIAKQVRGGYEGDMNRV